MKNKNSKYLLILASVMLLSSCGSSSSSSSISTPTATSSEPASSVSSIAHYTIIFANYDGTELQTYSLEEGTTPVFFGSNPTRPIEGDKCFVFSGWDKPIVPATADATYTATYKESTIEAESLNRLQFTYQSSSTSYSVGKNSASTSDLSTIIIPSSFDDGTNGSHPVTFIDSTGFNDSQWLKSITIPTSVTAIGDLAFNHCEELTSVSFGDGLETINNYAFYDCTSLSAISLPASLKTIKLAPFYGCTSLAKIEVSEANTSFATDSRALFSKDSSHFYFYANASGTSYSLPVGTTLVGLMAFERCDQLSEVVLPSSLFSIPAFAYCTGLTKISVDASNTFLTSDSRALYSKDKTTLYAYAENSGDSFEVPSTVTAIEGDVFRGAVALKSITLPEGLLTIGDYAFGECSSLTEVHLPSTLTRMGNYLFMFCTDLKTVNIPSSITAISFGAFLDCHALTSIVLPASITAIEPLAFCDCFYLKSLTYEGTLASWAKITLGERWKDSAALKVAHCSDGDVTLA